jgi:amino acid adenylation domain-containing protein
MSDVPSRITGLSEERRALLEVVLREEGAGAPVARTGILRRGGLERPVSFSQERLWFLDQLQPGSPVYNIPVPIPLYGPLDPEALARSLDAIVARHEVLRTTFALRKGRPVQVIAPELHLEVRRHDLAGRPAPELHAEVQRLADQETRTPFDLAHGPLLRAALLRLGEQENLLFVTFHHIVFDAWSIEVFQRELATLYAAQAQDQPSLPELPVQYGDFAEWQREWLRGPNLEGLLEYWRQRLAGARTVLELPTDRPRSALQSLAGRVHPFALPSALAGRLRALGREERATLFMTCLAAFNVLLHRYTGQDDLLVGTPVSSRTRSELEGLIGLFLNTLVVRTGLTGRESFREVLRQVRERTLEAYAHQDLPFEMLVERLQPDRNLSVTPLFQVLFVLQAASPAAQEAGRTEGDTEEGTGGMPQPTTGTAKFDLSLYLTDTGQEIAGAWEHNAHLFFPTTVARMAGHLQALLEAVAEDPDRPLSGLPLLSEPERQSFREWNDTRADYPRHRCPHELFEEQAARTPDGTAVVFAGESLTYAGLNRRANRLAHRLRSLGIGPEVPVGICVERSPEMVVGLLGVLKAGGVHLPLDPAYPRERLGFMLADARVPVLLTQERLAGRLPEHGARVILLDRPLDAETADLEAESAENPTPAATPDNLGYVIYTSGSTGRPKGVGMGQRALSNLTHWQNGLSPVGLGGRTLQFTSFSFDVSFLEILSTLSLGGTLVLMPEETRRDLAGIARLLAEERVERLFLPFAALQHLAETLEGAEETGLVLRQVVSTGEALHITGPVARLLRGLEGCTLHNEYGPTETHFVTEHTLPGGPGGDPAEWPALPPIGRPLPNASVRLLDRELRPVPAGVPGELYAAGAVLARGYLGRPDLTAEKFLPDPFGDEPGSRLYRTGDLARWLPDGNVEYLGRLDHQVKIRGFRIELGEVEVVLGRHPGLQDVAVVARGDGGDRRLVAYAVPRQEPAPSVTELRGFLLERLPEHMVPSAFVLLDRLPLGATGKVDRLSLPEPELARPDLEGAYAPPRSPVEEELARIWAEVLTLDRVGVHDNFFELGGHSLLATQLITRVREAFQIDLPLRHLFEFPTVAELALALVQRQIEESDGGDVAALLEELEGLSPEEVQALLADEDPSGGL